MSQHDFSIANQGFPSFRSDLNDGLQALVSNSSGATAPSTTYAHQFWVDTAADPSILKVRNADNDAWITLGNIDQTGDTFIFTPAAGSASAPAYTTSGDLNTGVFFPGADIVALSAGGAEKLMASTSEVVVNDGSADVDFRVESDANTHALFVEGSSGNVGIGTSSPSHKLDLYDASGDASINVKSNGTYSNILFSRNDSGGDVRVRAEVSNNSLHFITASSERARIDSSGNLLVNLSAAPFATWKMTVDGGSNEAIGGISNNASSFSFVAWNKATSGNNTFVGFFTESTITSRGSISYNRGAGLVAYNTTSDYRAKNISGPVTDALQTIAELKPYMGTMKGATVERPMFVAHEAQVTAPYCVTGEKDAVNEQGDPIYQQMDNASLVPLLVAAIQEQQAIIEGLTARITALEQA